MADEAPAPKAKRASKPKSRSGCITCKVRRVKCDEAKPICQRCQSFGVDCDGYRHCSTTPSYAKLKFQMEYIIPSSSSSPKQLKRLAQEIQGLAPLPRAPSTVLSTLDESESRYFQVFQERTASEMAGFFDSDVWNITILQVCHDESFARHAVIALGALYISINRIPSHHSPTNLPLALQIENPHHVCALQQYGKALHLMRGVPQQNTHRWARNTIISCLLTTYFEAYIGNLDSSIAQAQAGVDLIDRIHSNDISSSLDDFGYLSANSTLIDSGLIGIFARLEAVVKYYQNEHHIKWKSRPIRATPPAEAFYDNIPDSFATSKEAKYCWDILVARFIRYKNSFSELAYDSDNDFRDGMVQQVLFNLGDLANVQERELPVLPVFVEACTRWFQAFAPILRRSTENPGTNEFFSTSVMYLQYLTSIIVLSLSVESTECACDRFLAEYNTIIKHAEEVLEATHIRDPPGPSLSKSMFAFDCNLTWSLKLVGTKCRDRIARRRAINLMRSYPRREGCRDNEMAVAVTTWLMEMEEDGVTSEVIPEEARLKIERMNEMVDRRQATMVCSRLIEGSDEREKLPEVTITW